MIHEVQAVVAELAGPVPSAPQASARSVAIVVPGVVDAAAGRAEFSANLGFRDLPLRDLSGRVLPGGGVPRRVTLAGNRVDDLAGIDALQIRGRGPQVGGAELALDDVDRHAFAGQLDSVSVAPLVGSESPADAGL